MKSNKIILTLFASCLALVSINTDAMWCCVESPEVKQYHLNEKLINAAYLGYFGDVRKYLNRGADVRYYDEKRWTALFYAVSNGNIPIVQMLCKAGSDINYRDVEKLTALKLAARAEKRKRNFDGSSYLKIARLLLTYDTNAELLNSEYRNIMNCGSARMKRLLDKYKQKYTLKFQNALHHWNATSKTFPNNLLNIIEHYVTTEQQPLVQYAEHDELKIEV